MTKAEAIKELKMMLTDNSNTGDMYNALKMAVEALSELDNNSTKVDNKNVDLINRREAIEMLSEIRCGYNCFDESEEPYYEALSMAIERLSNTPNTFNTLEALDCISRQDALKAIEFTWAGKAAFDAIKALPSEQPERKKGKWIDQDDGAFYPVECSECRKIPLFDVDGDYILSNFCPNCGCRMDKGG